MKVHLFGRFTSLWRGAKGSYRALQTREYAMDRGLPRLTNRAVSDIRTLGSACFDARRHGDNLVRVGQIGRHLTITGLVLVLALLGVAAAACSKAPTGPQKAALPDLPVEPGQLAAEWQPTGGPYEKVTPIHALALGPSSEVLYAGTWGKGLYRSDDSGLTWLPTSELIVPEGMDSLADAQIHELLVMPDGKTIYMSPWNRSLWRSQDGGATWGSAGLIMPFNNAWNVDALVLDRDDPNVLYQGTWGGVHKSEDGGDTWALEDVDPILAPEAKQIYALIQDADGTLYAGTVRAGVYRSTDRADTWQAFGLQGSELASRVFSLVARQGTLWAGTQDGVYRRRAGEEEWIPVNKGIDPDLRARTVQVLALDDRGGLYAGTVDYGVYHSTDDGDTWESYSDPWSIVSMLYDAGTHSLYVGTASGDGIQRHDGTGWEAINEGLSATAYPVQSLAFAGREQDHLLVGTWVGGMYRSEDRGQSWSPVPDALPVGLARDVPDIAVIGGGRIIVLATGTGIRRSEDYGQNWYWATSGLPEGEHRVRCLAQGQRDPRLVFALLELQDGFGIYRSTDGGSEWRFHSTLTGVYDLALSGDDKTLLATQIGKGILVSVDEGGSWPELRGRDIVPYGLQIVARERNAWQRLVLGLESQSLHVRALNGLYSSFDGGENWRATLPGQLEAAMADPTRPGVLYATSAPDTVSLPGVVTRTATVPNVFWVSRDDGRSWTQASSSDRPLTALALDPLDHNRLYAGTSDGGVYYTTLSLPSPYAAMRAVTGLTAFVIAPALVSIGLPAMYLYFRLELRLRLYPWQIWALLLRTRAWRLVGTPRSELGPLERLIAVVATGLKAPWMPEAMWEALQNLGVVLPLVQIQTTVSDLRRLGLFVHTREGGYRFALVVLARLTALNFEREPLVDQVRSRSMPVREAETFFGRAGFQVTDLARRLSLWPELPHYRALGRLNAWLHTHRQLEEADVAQLIEGTDAAGCDLGFVVLDHTPTPGAYRAMWRARLVPLSRSEIRRAMYRHEEEFALERMVREGQGWEDLYDRREPLRDHLALFGRGALLSHWLAAAEQGQNVYLSGLPCSGRTSTLWWLQARMADRRITGYVDLRLRGSSWSSVLRSLLSDLLSELRRTPMRLSALPELDDVLASCGPDLDLGLGLDHMAVSVASAYALRFALFLDGANSGAVLDQLGPLTQRGDVVLCVSWDGLPSDLASVSEDQWLPPLTSLESHTLLQTIGARMGLDFSEEDLVALNQAAGGHPFLLRQLGSQAARMAGWLDVTSAQGLFQPGEWPERSVSKAIPTEAVLQACLEQRGDVLERLWQALPAFVRRDMRLLASGQPLDPDRETAYAALGLLTREEGSGPCLRIGLLDRWLAERQR